MTIEHSPESEGSTRFRPAKVKLEQGGLGTAGQRGLGQSLMELQGVNYPLTMMVIIEQSPQSEGKVQSWG